MRAVRIEVPAVRAGALFRKQCAATHRSGKQHRVSADQGGGIWGAARHALTVGFIATMVFAIGQRVLPAFGGARVLHSPRLMPASLLTLTAGCAPRFDSETPAYEGYSQAAWHVLPCSAVIELLAASLFTANLLATFARPPRIYGAPQR